jgi:hypothetical protein
VGGRGRRRLAVGALSAAGHAAVVAALLTLGAPAPPPALEPPQPLPVVLVAPRRPPPPEPAKAAPPKPAVRRLPVHRTAPAPAVVPLVVAAGAESAGAVSDAELAGAAAAGAGPGEGCDMAGRLQAALGRDARIRAAVAQARAGRPVRVWDGAWVRHPGQDGAGLAAVREAIMWEVAFAPEACRRQPVRGLVLLTLADGPAPPRVVVGAGDWRWSDLLRRGG